MTPTGRYLGSWTLPSGNSCDAYLEDEQLACAWDDPPSSAWSRADVEHWQHVTFPAIVRAVAEATGHQRVLGVTA